MGKRDLVEGTRRGWLVRQPPLREIPEWLAAGAIGCLAAALLLTNLGNQYLWQDEAQTALIAKTIPSHGIPLGSDGRNFFSQEFGIEYGDDYMWKWHPWLSFYLVAGSFLVFGADTASARLPFALLGIATIVLSYFTARSFWHDRRAAAATAAMLALCVPFLILSRQARWYSVTAFLSLLGLYAYAQLGRREGKAWALLFLACALLLHTHYVYCGTLLGTLLIHAALVDRQKLRSVSIVGGMVGLFNLPWIAWFTGIRYGQAYAPRLSDFGLSMRYSREYLGQIFEHVFDPLFLVIPVAFAGVRYLRREPVLALPTGTWSNISLLLIFSLITSGALGFLGAGVYVRYLTPLIPPLFMVLGLIVGALLRHVLPLGVAVIGLWLATGSMGPFLYELTHDFDGPIEGIVEFLDQHGSGRDTVAITYGDLPLKFYTGMRVVGGLTGEDLTEAKGADWIIIRKHLVSPFARPVRSALVESLSEGEYLRHEIDYPDTPFENREDPSLHRFRTVKNEDRVIIYGKRR